MTFLQKFKSDKSGATAVVFALSLPVFIGAMVMAVEIGYLRQSKAKLQNAADMSAIAGARQIMIGLNANKQVSDYQDEIYYAAVGDAYENGYEMSDGTIVVNSPPTAGEYAGEVGVEIIVKQKKDSPFAKYFGQDESYVYARAVALAMEGETSACVLSLDPTGWQTVTVSGSAALNLDGCTVRSNSSATEAIGVGGSASITAECVYAVGGVSASTESNLTMTDPDCTAVKTGVDTVMDPYGHIEAPTAAELSAMPCQTPVMETKWTMSLPQGRYCSVVNHKDLIKLEPGGTYYFDNADLVLKSGFAELRGTNVTLIFMNGGNFHNSNSGLVNLTAKTSGEYAGIVMYGDRNTSDPTEYVSVAGNAASVIEGAIYFPVQNMSYRGGSSGVSECTQVIGYTVDFGGNASLTNTNCGTYGARSIGGRASGVVLFE